MAQATPSSARSASVLRAVSLGGRSGTIDRMHAPALSSPTWSAITTEPDGLGESPFWHPQEQRLYWVDIPGRRIARVAVDGLQAQGPVAYWPLTQEPGCIAPVQGGGLVMALRDGIYLAREWGGPLQLLATAPYDTAKQRFNDGKCDAQGRFWAGSLYEPKDQPLGALYMLDGQGLHNMQGGVVTANGLAWSPDGRTAYWADTAAHQVRALTLMPPAANSATPACSTKPPPNPQAGPGAALRPTAVGLTVRRSISRAATGQPNTKADACCAFHHQARCWPKCQHLPCAPPCPALAGRT